MQPTPVVEIRTKNPYLAVPNSTVLNSSTVKNKKSGWTATPGSDSTGKNLWSTNASEFESSSQPVSTLQTTTISPLDAEVALELKALQQHQIDTIVNVAGSASGTSTSRAVVALGQDDDVQAVAVEQELAERRVIH